MSKGERGATLDTGSSWTKHFFFVCYHDILQREFNRIHRMSRKRRFRPPGVAPVAAGHRTGVRIDVTIYYILSELQLNQ